MDKCPNNPGTAENGGCPKSKEITRAGLVLKGVNFESGKATLLEGSYKVLDEMAESLREWPEINIEIQGHTDNTGNAAKNLQLSQERAETVRQYLIGKGIAPERLTAVGYGQDKPIADNKTAGGRAQNRRVEVTRSN
jgi:outer membrane protein OmpA-like peptidoglycan-associated protein